jgi:hypothetical protein
MRLVRLIVRFIYAKLKATAPRNGIAFIVFVGTHKDYDKLDVESLGPPLTTRYTAMTRKRSQRSSAYGRPSATKPMRLASSCSPCSFTLRAFARTPTPLDPIEAIKFRMDQQGLSRKDLIPVFGTHVSPRS